jgi:hypothetical protein
MSGEEYSIKHFLSLTAKTHLTKIQKYGSLPSFDQVFREWGSRDRISGDQNRKSKVLPNFQEIENIAKFSGDRKSHFAKLLRRSKVSFCKIVQEIESLILQNCSGDRKDPRRPRELGWVRLG